jgi:hypothetical protein
LNISATGTYADLILVYDLVRLPHGRVEQMAPPESSWQSLQTRWAAADNLIAEDNPLNMKLFSAMIASQAMTCCRRSHLQGLAMAQQQHPELVIMDVNCRACPGWKLPIPKTDETPATSRSSPPQRLR